MEGKGAFGAIFLHGAGAHGGDRFFALAEASARIGGESIVLDFLGHGKSGGNIAESSLESRIEQAKLVVEEYFPLPAPLLVWGFSMGGHTALRLAALLGEHVKGIGLLAPACYAQEAESLPFGVKFSEVLRRSESWRDSGAFIDASTFSGRVSMVVGSLDQTIPWGVTEKLLESFRFRSHSLRLDILGEVGHNVLAAVEEKQDLLAQITAFLAEACRA